MHGQKGEVLRCSEFTTKTLNIKRKIGVKLLALVGAHLYNEKKVGNLHRWEFQHFRGYTFTKRIICDIVTAWGYSKFATEANPL